MLFGSRGAINIYWKSSTDKMAFLPQSGALQMCGLQPSPSHHQHAYEEAGLWRAAGGEGWMEGYSHTLGIGGALQLPLAMQFYGCILRSEFHRISLVKSIELCHNSFPFIVNSCLWVNLGFETWYYAKVSSALKSNHFTIFYIVLFIFYYRKLTSILFTHWSILSTLLLILMFIF